MSNAGSMLKSCSAKEAAAAVAKATMPDSKASLQAKQRFTACDGKENPEKAPFLNPCARAACFLSSSSKGRLSRCPLLGPWHKHSEPQYRNSLYWSHTVLLGSMCCLAGSTRTLQAPVRTDRLVLEVFLESSFSSCGGQQGQHFSIFMVGGHMSPQSSRKGAAQGCMCAGVRGYAPRQSSLPPPQTWKDSELRQEEVTKILGRNFRNKYPRSSSKKLQPQKMGPDPQVTSVPAGFLQQLW